eukprot:m.268636 g.268636  ORF g.268636 m.268636 type:complete len:1773 (+) comp16256_c0_seq17:253-5571(+)
MEAPMVKSRLDRLLKLLDQGTTPGARKAAAHEIGEIVRRRPQDLQLLLYRVHHYLRSSVWETRIAASQAFKAITSNVQPWNPLGIKTEQPLHTDVETPESFSFATFDLTRVLRHATPLLGSQGLEYDLDAETLKLNPKERLKRQRQLLKEQLGLDDAAPGMQLDPNIMNELDVTMKPGTQSLKRKREEVQEQLPDLSGMSARERNRAKRKLKEKSIKKNHGESAPKDDDDFQNFFSTEDEWPFQARCEELCNDLFHPKWEIRHGAALGLREILNTHGRGAGKHADTPMAALQSSNASWLEDMSLRLLCVCALDHFGDFMLDNVVAPVRDTAAQAVGAILKHMIPSAVDKVLDILLKLQTNTDWQVRHGGLLGVKYLVAVREDLLDTLIPKLLPVITAGLQDMADDVRAASADALYPITKKLAICAPSEVKEIMEILWDALLELDDLTSSTSSVLRLLAKFLETDDKMAQTASLGVCVPRLWPFFRHQLPSVRRSVLNTLIIIAKSAKGEWINQHLPENLSLVLQNLLLEHLGDIQQLSSKLWDTLIEESAPNHQASCFISKFGTWCNLVVTPAGAPLDPKLMLKPEAQPSRLTRSDRSESESAQQKSKRPPPLKYLIGGPDQDTSPDPAKVLHARASAAEALGQLLARMHSFQEAQSIAVEGVLELFHSRSSVRRVSSALICAEWARRASLPVKVAQALVDYLSNQQASSVMVAELLHLVGRMRSEAAGLLHACADSGIPLKETMVLGEPSNLNANQVMKLIELVDNFVKNYQLQQSGKDRILKRKVSLQGTVEQLQSEFLNSKRVMLSLVARAVAFTKQLPAKVSPLIKPLMETLKKDNIELMQHYCAEALSELLLCCVNREKCPNAKVIENLCQMVCKYKERNPDLTNPKNCLREGTLTLTRESEAEASALEAKKQARGKGKVLKGIDNLDPSLLAESNSTMDFIEFRGGKMALERIVTRSGDGVIKLIPSLWNHATSAFSLLKSPATDVNDSQPLVNSLQILEIVSPVLDDSLKSLVFGSLDAILESLRFPCVGVRFKAAQCLATLANEPSLTLTIMVHIIDHLLPRLGDTANIVHRQGASEGMYHVISELQLRVLPYLVILVIPMLGRLSDFDDNVRQMCSRTFATLIRLMPLEGGASIPTGFPANLLDQKKKQRKFLDQLMDPSKLERYQLPVPIKAELRSYQQSGLDWMNFLNKYQLHGILCDDMGLGKTLQSICILAGSHHDRSVIFKDKQDPSCAPLPSLVICPTTLTSHWYAEIQRFCESLKPLHYTGKSKHAREILRNEISTSDVVILSYNSLNSEIDYFSTLKFNYCILDEGHVIKNSKSKTTIAVKRVRSNHRIILSGTPLQNRVQELWSLFDFLMPGYLGTETQFNVRYGKPIARSRQAKMSAKDEEAGAQALEQLHRQVLPFLLRRMKEDVLHDLPPKIIQDYYCDLTDIQHELHKNFSENQGKQAMLQNVDSSAGPPKHIFQALQYLRKLCNHPSLVLTDKHPMYKTIKREYPTLDSMELSGKMIGLAQLLMDCGLGDRDDDKDTDDLGSTSVMGQHRCLIFALSKDMLDLVQRTVFKGPLKNVTHLRLDGTVPPAKRQDIVDKFNRDPTIDLLLLTTSIGGLGLTLTGADTVIFLENSWNPASDLQAMDRAHRIGQKKVVNVYRLITRGTLEEKIMNLQRFKQNITNTVITSDNKSISSMGTDQLLDLFEVMILFTHNAVFSMCCNLQVPATEDKKKEVSGAVSQSEALASLEELWDENQYAEEFDINKFVASMRE